MSNEVMKLVEKLLPNSLPTERVKVSLPDRNSQLDPLDFNPMEQRPGFLEFLYELRANEPDKIPALSGPNGLKARVGVLAKDALKGMVEEDQIKVRFAYPAEARDLLGIEDESAYVPGTVVVQVAKTGKAGELSSREIVTALRDRLVKGGNQADVITRSSGDLFEAQALVLNLDKVVVLLRD